METSNCSQEFSSFFQSYCLTPTFDKETRVADNSATIIIEHSYLGKNMWP